MVKKSVVDVNLEELREAGYDAIIFDLDNTLVGWRAKTVPQDVTRWLERAGDLGFKMCIVSNSLVRRVTKFSELLGIPAIPKAIKPMQRPFLRALHILNAHPQKVVVIGDQVFTDVLGGNRLGSFTILVRPVDKREFFTTILFRTAEKLVLFRLRKKGMLKDFFTKKEKC
ncbi:MAG: YqeG family HAD IIIA-type phosphatase [Armatimonadetes bacterium]|nr:YqeG family HAD IIIA-type phosphatase [Armatimonadota bacterium]